MNLDDIMSREASHKKKNTVSFHLYEVLRIVRIIKTESIMVVARGWGEGRMGSCFLKAVLQDGNSYGNDGTDDCTRM